ncbi:MAG TPA: hypothetical protein EYQ00_08400 [Dehalococcoidia bacterium]|jgi:galactose mutarotase-like enzyme|nr:hypothetical protein [Dehalococcoidia bacterium]
MNIGDQVRIVTGRRMVRVQGRITRKMETYRLSEEEQRIAIVLKLGASVKQMTVLTQEGKVKFWFNHQCEVVA